MANSDKGAAYLDKHAAEMPEAFSTFDLRAELLRVHREGYAKGDKTGWPQVDELYSVAPGQLTTITGYPNSGKSQWLDALSLNLARQGWRFVFCSLENIPVVLHAEKLSKQYIGKPMREGPRERMTEDEVIEAATDMADWFAFLRPSEAKPNPSVFDVMAAIERNFKERDLWGVKDAKLAAVIDPWNELEHVRPSGMTLTEYVGECLSRLRQWTRANMLHLFVVAHPAKQPRNRDSGKLPIPTPDMISDSAHFWNKSDNCIAIALTNEHDSPEVDIHIQKIRFSHIGHRGAVTLLYDKVTGRYGQKSAIKSYAQREGS